MTYENVWWDEGTVSTLNSDMGKEIHASTAKRCYINSTGNNVGNFQKRCDPDLGYINI